jgi:stalled ribosome rescue protein Dom34
MLVVNNINKEKCMKKKVALWIDHRKTVIVFLAGEEEEIKVIKSNVEKQKQRATGSRSGGPFESQAVPSDDRRQRAFTGHLDTYYNEVISRIRDAESILIFGPGEAKGELKKHIDREGLGGRIIGIETVDEMTDPQIAAKARKHFLNQT